jgi:hypothetical protein
MASLSCGDQGGEHAGGDIVHAGMMNERIERKRARCLRVLQGGGAGVLRGLGELATQHGLSGSKQNPLRPVGASLEKNRPRRRYEA